MTASFGGEAPVRADEGIQLVLSREMKRQEERVAVFIGTTDVSSLFVLDGLRLRYDAKLWRLPIGESPVVVYLVSKESEWQEIARFTLRVANDKTSGVQNGSEALVARESEFAESFLKTKLSGPSASFDSNDPVADEGASDQQSPSSPQPKAAKARKMKFTPSLTLSFPSQPAQSTFPGPQPQRATFVEGNLQASLKNEATFGILQEQSSFDVAGSTFENEALRFGTLGNQAPKVDLSSYLVQFQTGKVKYQVGHFSYGTQRELINSFSSRGIMITVPFLKRFDVSAAAMNGTQLVGYNNFLGLSRSKHQMWSSTIGFELFPKRPGGLRVEVGWLSAYFQPINGVNRGVITDLQRSHGVSLRLIASNKDGRFHFDGGFTRSLFASPIDTTLNQGTNTVAVPALARNAQYLDASYDILRNYSLSKTKKVNLNVAFREENVAPLFRSLGASTQADKIQYEVALNGSLNEISAQFSYLNFHDNLRNIPSILRSLTGNTHFSLAAPAGALLFWLGPDQQKSAWLPRIAYSFNRTHQFGAAVPVNGGFEIDPASVPNFFGTNQTFSADWQIKKYTIGYNLNHSFQDNEQRGRERADQGVLVNTGRFGLALNSKLNLNIDLSSESSANRETGRIDRTYRLGPGLSWQFSRHMSLSANLANTIAGDAANTSHSRNTEFDGSWIYRFQKGKEGLRKISGQFFIRYANTYARSLDSILVSNTLRKNQTLTANLGVTFF